MEKQKVDVNTVANAKKVEKGAGNGFVHQKGLNESALNMNKFNPLDRLAFMAHGRKDKISVLQIGGSMETAQATKEFFQNEGIMVDIKAVCGSFSTHFLKEGVIFESLTGSGRVEAKPGNLDYIVYFGATGSAVVEKLQNCLKEGGIMFDDSIKGTHPPTIQMHKKVDGLIETTAGDFLSEK